MASSVHVVFKTHLDVGFTDLAETVVRRYHEVYIPRAIALARELRESAGPVRFIWTTGSWIIADHLEQADASGRSALEEAIAAGDIAWHALPFNTHTELLDASLLEAGLIIAADLDRRFDRRTIAAKLTDVPGHTIGLVPVLSAAGVRFLHIGVNPCSTVPEVPPCFRWRAPDGSELVVAYSGDYGGTVFTPDGEAALHIAHSVDNTGPPPADEVYATFSRLQREHPNAMVQASTLDAFAEQLLTQADQLPVIESEIGDTWIHGVGSDPWKVAAFRSLLRRRRVWLAEGRAEAVDLAAADRRLLLVAEHTWGLDEKTHLADYVNYSRPDFEAARARDRVGRDALPDRFADFSEFVADEGGNGVEGGDTGGGRSYRRFERSWAEQRAYLDEAVAALPPALQAEGRKALAEATAPRPTVSEAQPVAGQVRLGDWTVEVGGDGGLIRCRHEPTGVELADHEHRLFAASYQRFDNVDYDLFLDSYLRCDQNGMALWALADFSKPGIEFTGLAATTWRPRLDGCWHEDGVVLAELSFPEEAVTTAGAPPEMWLVLSIEDDGALLADWRWFDKPANRLPEALWLHLAPAGEGRWIFHKLGSAIDPMDVVAGGNRRLHAVGDAVERHGHNGRLVIQPLDSPLVALGEPSLLRFDGARPDPTGGIHINVANNVWGTNFPMWIEGEGRSRVRLSI